MHYGSSYIAGVIGIIICSFLVGYLSRESIKFVLGYAIVIDLILFLLFSNDSYVYPGSLLTAYILIIILAFAGKYVKIIMEE